MDNQPKILIVEDEMLIAADLSMQLTKLGYKILGIHTRAEDALKTIEINRPDIILMDIILSGEMNGITAAHEVHDRFQIPVIFLTSNFDDTTFQKAKAAKPYAFISKPFRKDDLVRAIEITLERISEEAEKSVQSNDPDEDEISSLDDRLFIRQGDQMVMVPIDQILVLEADRNYCKIVTQNKTYLVSLPMGKIEELLPSSEFLRTHRSYVVNIKRISSFGENQEYLMVNEFNVPISRRMKEDVIKRFRMI